MWALVWFLFLGVGVLVYIFYYMAKSDELVYLRTPSKGLMEAVEPERDIGVSWTGLIGGLLGLGPLAAVAAAVLTDPPEIGRPLAAVPALMAALYLPAVWASVARTERRQPILRGSIVVSLVLAFGGSFMFGFVVMMVLAPATVLLWLASGAMRRAGKR